MDPFIKVPPDHYGGIERVVADLADRLARLGHDVTLWAAPGSRVNGTVEPFGREGEWTRWSNVRNTLTLAGRFLRGARRFDVIHNFGRLAYLAPVLPRDVPKVQTYMRTVDPRNMATARRLGARRLHYTAVSAAIRDTGTPGGGDWSVIYNCAVPDRYSFAGSTDPVTAPLVFLGRLDRCKGVHHAITVARPAAAPPDHRGQHLAARARAGLLQGRDPAAHRRRSGHLHRSGRRRGEAGAARRRGGDADADRVGRAVSGGPAGIDAVWHAAHRVSARRRPRRDRSRSHRFSVRHARRDGRLRIAAARDRSRGRSRRSRETVFGFGDRGRVPSSCTANWPLLQA